MGQPDQPQQGAQIIMPQEMLGGVWSNFARVSHSPHEFTLDFCRVEYGSKPTTGLVVSRVNLSPLMVTQLMAALNENWQRYADKAMPKEVRGDDAEEG